MRYAIEIEDGVELSTGSTPLPDGAIEPIPNWNAVVIIPSYYLKVVGSAVVEKTQAEKDAYDEAHPPTIEELQEDARQYLQDTDWYIIREADNAVVCPVEIRTARQDARDLL